MSTSTVTTVTPIALDDAITAVKTAEGAYVQAQNADGGAASALAQAQAAKSGTASTVANTGAAYLQALQQLDASIQAVEATIPAPVPAPAS